MLNCSLATRRRSSSLARTSTSILSSLNAVRAALPKSFSRSTTSSPLCAVSRLRKSSGRTSRSKLIAPSALQLSTMSNLPRFGFISLNSVYRTLIPFLGIRAANVPTKLLRPKLRSILLTRSRRTRSRSVSMTRMILWRMFPLSRCVSRCFILNSDSLVLNSRVCSIPAPTVNLLLTSPMLPLLALPRTPSMATSL